MFSEIFKGKCSVCKDVCHIKEPICCDCKLKLERLTSYCGECGFPLKREGMYCPRCTKAMCPSVDFIYANYKYAGGLRRLLLDIKFSYNIRSALSLSKILYLPDGIDGNKYDGIVSVPSHFVRRFRRFYHPADIGAKFISNSINVPCLNGLCRMKYTHFQYKLKAEKRKENVKGAFKYVCKENPLRILLIDDILTTGTTINECAKTLKLNGVDTVDCFVIAID